MGCAASTSSSTAGGGSTGKKNGVVDAAADAPPKFRYGTPDYTVLGAGTKAEDVTVATAFSFGKSTVFLLTVPVVKSDYPTDALTAAAADNKEGEEKKEEGEGDANEKEEGTAGAATTTGDAAPAAIPADEATPVATPPAGSDRPVARWAIYNDGKPDVRIQCFLFHAAAIRVIPSAATTERRAPDTGRLQADVTVAGLQTVAYIEGPISGYMWKCLVKSADGEFQPSNEVDARLL